MASAIRKFIKKHCLNMKKIKIKNKKIKSKLFLNSFSMDNLEIIKWLWNLYIHLNCLEYKMCVAIKIIKTITKTGLIALWVRLRQTLKIADLNV